MKWLYIFASMFILFPTNAFSGEITKQQICKCIQGLKAFEVDIKKHKPKLNPAYVRSLRGIVLLNADFTGTEFDNLINKVGYKEDVIYCLSSALDNDSVDILLKAYHGYLSENPFDDFARCYAAFLSKASTFDKKYGKKGAYDIGCSIGEKMGEVSVSLNRLYKDQNFTFEDLNSAGVKYLQSLASKEEKERKRLLGSYCKICEWYNIPLESVLTGADVVIK